jgi:hypothetical protein
MTRSPISKTKIKKCSGNRIWNKSLTPFFIKPSNVAFVQQRYPSFHACLLKKLVDNRKKWFLGITLSSQGGIKRIRYSSQKNEGVGSNKRIFNARSQSSFLSFDGGKFLEEPRCLATLNNRPRNRKTNKTPYRIYVSSLGCIYMASIRTILFLDFMMNASLERC